MRSATTCTRRLLIALSLAVNSLPTRVRGALMRCNTGRAYIGGIVAALILLSSCSLFDNNPWAEEGSSTEDVIPKPQTVFFPIIGSSPTCIKFPPVCSLNYEGVLTDIENISDPFNNYWRLVFDEGALQADLWYTSHIKMPLNAGTTYRITLKSSYSIILSINDRALEIADANGMVFFGKTEHFFDGIYNPPLPQGWTVTMEPGGFDGYDRGCGFRGTPQVLVVSHGGERIRLVEGQAGRLGAYLVTVLVAEKVDQLDPGQCLDRVIPEVSYVITRVEE